MQEFRIVRFTAQNVKRIKAIDITPETDVVRIAGRNGQGKTSLLDAIEWTLAGGRKIQPMPIRYGEDRAHTQAYLGNDGKVAFIVERRWTASGSTLTIKNPDGFRADAPQSLLDELVGEISFDPMAFMTMQPRDKAKLLASLVGIDTDAIAAKRKGIVEERRDLARALQATRAKLDAMQRPDNPPTSRTALDDLLRQRAEIARQERDAREQEQAIAWQRERLASQEVVVRRARLMLDEATATLDAIKADLARIEAEPKVAVPDVEQIEAMLRAADRNNQAFDAAAVFDATAGHADELQGKIDALTADIEAVDVMRLDAIAKAKMPVAGLAFDQDGMVTCDGVPIEQTSGARQILISTAMAAALNPRLRVIRIRHGSDLDPDSMRALQDWAATNRMQIWVECVDVSGEAGFVIEDGVVVEPDSTSPERPASAPAPKPAKRTKR